MQFERDMYTIGNALEGKYPPRFPTGLAPLPHWQDTRTFGHRKPGALQLLRHPQGGPAEQDWSPLWLIAGILLGYLLLRTQ
jgi:hypothetical protein